MLHVRYPDGRCYTHEEHHFLQYYRNGLPALRDFYQRHQPTNVLEHHFLAVPEGSPRPALGWPWFDSSRPIEARGEAGLGPEHGNQAYGPVSEQKLRLEARRLHAVLASIERHGFQPERGGYAQGFFMLRSAGDWVFVVLTGFHRTAAMAHLGFTCIEARFEPGVPRFVEENDVTMWPMVRSGQMTAREALLVYAQYFRRGVSAGGAGAG